MMRIGALSIGESPRPDLLVEIASTVDANRIKQWGALDGLSRATVERDNYRVPLITKLKQQTVLVERDWIAERLQSLIDNHHASVDAFIVLCAEDFSVLRSPVPLFIPYLLARNALETIGFDGRMGVVCPVAGQVASADTKWSVAGWEPFIEVASPFAEGELDGAVERLVALDSNLILLDCTSFSQSDAQRLSRSFQRSVVAVRSFAWAILKELAAHG